jgi:hypothetical protein
VPISRGAGWRAITRRLRIILEWQESLLFTSEPASLLAAQEQNHEEHRQQYAEEDGDGEDFHERTMAIGMGVTTFPHLSGSRFANVVVADPDLVISRASA